MAKRLLDGGRLWRSDKLKRVQPESFRAEYANLLPLALANGSFECTAEKIWCEVYAFNRESFKPPKIAKILDEFERVKLLFRWTADDGNVWGYWTGIETTLPSAKQIEKKHYKKGEIVPPEQLKRFLQSAPKQAQGNSEHAQGNSMQARPRVGLGWNGLEGSGEGLDSARPSFEEVAETWKG